MSGARLSFVDHHCAFLYHSHTKNGHAILCTIEVCRCFERGSKRRTYFLVGDNLAGGVGTHALPVHSVRCSIPEETCTTKSSLKGSPSPRTLTLTIIAHLKNPIRGTNIPCDLAPDEMQTMMTIFQQIPSRRRKKQHPLANIDVKQQMHGNGVA